MYAQPAERGGADTCRLTATSDKTNVQTALPFPGTALFNQVVKDKLLLGEWNLNELWKTPVSLGQADFLIKPYKLKVIATVNPIQGISLNFINK